MTRVLLFAGTTLTHWSQILRTGCQVALRCSSELRFGCILLLLAFRIAHIWLVVTAIWSLSNPFMSLPVVALKTLWRADMAARRAKGGVRSPARKRPGFQMGRWFDHVASMSKIFSNVLPFLDYLLWTLCCIPILLFRWKAVSDLGFEQKSHKQRADLDPS